MVVAFVMFKEPAICDFESQNRSVTFPPITVKELLAATPAVDKLTTTKPPWNPRGISIRRGEKAFFEEAKFPGAPY